MSQSATFLRFVFTIAAGLWFASSGWAVNLVYFRSSPVASAGLYDFNTDTHLSTLRVAIPFSGLSPNVVLQSLAVRPSDGTVFGIDSRNPLRKLVQLDVNTGQTNIIGTLTNSLGRLAIEPGTGALWSVGGTTGSPGTPGVRALYRINPANAEETLVVNLPSDIVTPLEFLDDGTLLGYSAGTLYRLDTATGQATPIGVTTPRLPLLVDFAHVGNRLFATASTNSSLDIFIWEIDVATAHATLLGPQASVGVLGGGLIEIMLPSKLTIGVASIFIKFPSLIGTTYQVQYRSPETANIWTDLGEPISGTGSEISVIDSNLDDTQRTYRLQMFP